MYRRSAEIFRIYNDSSNCDGHCAVTSDRFGYSGDMEDGGVQRPSRSCLECQLSLGTTSAHWQGENEIYQSAEQYFGTEIFGIVKVVNMRPRPVYELEDLNLTPLYN